MTHNNSCAPSAAQMLSRNALHNAPMTTLAFRFACLLIAAASLWPQYATAQGTISGTITDARNGKPVANVTIRLGFNTFVLGWSPLPSVAPAITDADGQYVLNSVPAGSAHLLRIESPAPYLTQAWPDSPCLGTRCPMGTPIIVANGQVSTANASITTGGSIEGTVRRDVDGEPVVGARITFSRPDMGEIETITDTMGNYRRDHLPPGAYRVKAEALSQNLMSEVYDNVSCARSCPPGVQGEVLVSVAADTTRSGVDFGLAAGAAIAGSIRETGFESTRLRVGLRLQRLDGGQSAIWATKSLNAGTESFAFTALPAGSYRLSTYSSSAGPMYANEVYDNARCQRDDCSLLEINSGTPIAVVAGQVIDDIDLALDRAASVAGCIVDASTNLPLPGIDVIAYRVVGGGGVVLDPFPNLSKGTTGADGCYVIDALSESDSNPLYLRTFNQAGRVDQLHLAMPCWGGNCNLAAGTPILYGSGAQMSGYDFALPLGASISGVVRGLAGGMPLEGVAIRLHISAARPARYQDYEFKTNANGQFQTYGLIDGSYYLEVVVPSGRFAGRYIYGAIHDSEQPYPPISAGTPVLVESGNSVSGIEIVLDPITVYGDGFE